jgi:hypothetical protein
VDDLVQRHRLVPLPGRRRWRGVASCLAALMELIDAHRHVRDLGIRDLGIRGTGQAAEELPP